MGRSSMIAAALVVAMIAVPTIASAQAETEQKQGRWQERFKSADKDGTGMLSKDEVSASMPRLASRFEELDSNKDGQLSQDELRAGRQKRN